MTIKGRDRIADWIEVGLMLRGSRPMGLDPLHSFFESTVGLEAQRVNMGVREMGRRRALLGDRYPFRLHGDYAVQAATSAETSVYMAITLLAAGGPVRQYVSASPDETMALVFEELVVECTRRLWGEAGRALRFGWPSMIGRPPEFDLAIQWLAEKIGVDVGRGYRQPRRKDGGVDVVAWRPFPDGRSGFPLVLVQCTLQENLLAKGMDVDTRLWSSWLAMDVDPTVALATASALPPGTIWNELALKYMVLDRVRLVGLSGNPGVNESARAWMASVLGELRGHMGEVSEL